MEFTDEAKELYNLPYGLEGDRFDPRVDCNNAANYTQSQAAIRRRFDPSWPSDGRAHPERSIRNGIFGRNVAKPYRVDPDAARAAISCDEVQKIRDSYILNSAIGDPRNEAPYASNQLIGRRTERDVIADIINNPWSP
jgi:uncharacterized protein